MFKLEKRAKTNKEISTLIELGFEFICEKDDLKFFRKPNETVLAADSVVVPPIGFEPKNSGDISRFTFPFLIIQNIRR